MYSLMLHACTVCMHTGTLGAILHFVLVAPAVRMSRANGLFGVYSSTALRIRGDDSGTDASHLQPLTSQQIPKPASEPSTLLSDAPDDRVARRARRHTSCSTSSMRPIPSRRSPGRPRGAERLRSSRTLLPSTSPLGTQRVFPRKLSTSPRTKLQAAPPGGSASFTTTPRSAAPASRRRRVLLQLPLLTPERSAVLGKSRGEDPLL